MGKNKIKNLYVLKRIRSISVILALLTWLRYILTIEGKDLFFDYTPKDIIIYLLIPLFLFLIAYISHLHIYIIKIKQKTFNKGGGAN
jgi:hypothetical protein